MFQPQLSICAFAQLLRLFFSLFTCLAKQKFFMVWSNKT